MKFAKELEQELVPEWRAKYLDYKTGKKKLKAITRAIQKGNRSPLPHPFDMFRPHIPLYNHLSKHQPSTSLLTGPYQMISQHQMRVGGAPVPSPSHDLSLRLDKSDSRCARRGRGFQRL
ncbi:hypothetical protein N7451_008236 [Penicillium sp. IBT 35674x]|nr:hypothetical protein N7451_008236 [Penicillium sp. IBT 35674x]